MLSPHRARRLRAWSERLASEALARVQGKFKYYVRVSALLNVSTLLEAKLDSFLGAFHLLRELIEPAAQRQQQGQLGLADGLNVRGRLSTEPFEFGNLRTGRPSLRVRAVCPIG